MSNENDKNQDSLISGGKDELIQGHEYDGIQELDNPLPRWWLMTFYFTIIFAVGYTSYYVLLGGPSSDQSLQLAMTEIENSRPVEAVQPNADGEVDVSSLLSSPEALAEGQKVYVQFCQACHGGQGEGGIGPNLVDKYWIHSKGEAKGIMTAINLGYPTKGMPPWEAVIGYEDRLKVVAFVTSLQGSNPPNQKEPQGELIN